MLPNDVALWTEFLAKAAQGERQQRVETSRYLLEREPAHFTELVVMAARPVYQGLVLATLVFPPTLHYAKALIQLLALILMETPNLI